MCKVEEQHICKVKQQFNKCILEIPYKYKCREKECEMIDQQRFPLISVRMQSWNGPSYGRVVVDDIKLFHKKFPRLPYWTTQFAGTQITNDKEFIALCYTDGIKRPIGCGVFPKATKSAQKIL